MENIRYTVNWQKFKRGYSIFVPCLNCKQAREDVKRVLKRLRIEAIFKVVIEEGIKGLRIWRV